jgi:hypothetical protein
MDLIGTKNINGTNKSLISASTVKVFKNQAGK